MHVSRISPTTWSILSLFSTLLYAALSYYYLLPIRLQAVGTLDEMMSIGMAGPFGKSLKILDGSSEL